MSRDKREAELPVELETQFIMRLPEEPARELKNLLQSGDGLKNRLTIEFDQDMRKGEVKFDNRTMHGKIVDLPTVVESMKTIDNKSLYKTADICQMMICKEEPDQTTDDEMPTKNKKKDPYKVDKKYLYPHGITPPTKNVRKRRFRKTLRKKCAESPEIEKEVKRLLRADSEAESFTYEIINEEDEYLLYPKPDPNLQPSTSKKDKKGKGGRGSKRGKTTSSVSIDTPSTSASANTASANTASSNVVDIFGGAVSDSDLEDERSTQTHNKNTDGFAIHIAKADPMIGFGGLTQTGSLDFDSQVFALSNEMQSKMYASEKNYNLPGTSDGKVYGLPFEDEGEQSRDSRDSMTVRIELVKSELDELKERKKQTQLEIAGMENPTLRQRFQDTLHKLNQEVMYKDMEYQGLLTLQNSEDI